MRENANELEFRIGYTILLEEKYRYGNLLEKLPPERREEFLQYPIATLIAADVSSE